MLLLLKESQRWCFSAVLGFLLASGSAPVTNLGFSANTCRNNFSPHTAPLATPEALPSHLDSHLSSAKPDLLCFRCCFSYLKRSTAPCKIHSKKKEATEDTTLVLAKFSAPLPVFLPSHKPFCHNFVTLISHFLCSRTTVLTQAGAVAHL